MSSGMTIVSLQTNCRFLPTSCVIRTYAVLVLFPSLHQHITRTWLPSEPGIIWWIKNTIGELHSFVLLQNLQGSRKEMGLLILGSVISSVSSLRVNLVLPLNYIVESKQMFLYASLLFVSELQWCVKGNYLLTVLFRRNE